MAEDIRFTPAPTDDERQQAHMHLRAFQKRVEALMREFYVQAGFYPNRVVVPRSVADQLVEWHRTVTGEVDAIGGIETIYGVLEILTRPDARTVFAERKRSHDSTSHRPRQAGRARQAPVVLQVQSHDGARRTASRGGLETLNQSQDRRPVCGMCLVTKSIRPRMYQEALGRWKCPVCQCVTINPTDPEETAKDLEVMFRESTPEERYERDLRECEARDRAPRVYHPGAVVLKGRSKSRRKHKEEPIREAPKWTVF